MSRKMIMLIFYQTEKIIDKKCVFYEGPTFVTIIIRSRTKFHEFIYKLYKISGYEKQYKRLVVACRNLVLKEYITLCINDQKMMEIVSCCGCTSGKQPGTTYRLLVRKLATYKFVLANQQPFSVWDSSITCYREQITPIQHSVHISRRQNVLPLILMIQSEPFLLQWKLY